MAVAEATPVHAVQTLTSTGTFTNAQTVACGGKTYTTQTTLTDSDGNVLIGADAEATHANLKAAINLEAGAGTTYATSMTLNKQVKATAVTATTTTVKAKIPGTVGNNIPTTENQTNAAWGAAALAGGTGDAGAYIDSLISLNQINSEVLQDLKRLTLADD